MMPTKAKTITLRKFTEGKEAWHAIRWTVKPKYSSDDARYYEAFAVDSAGDRRDIRWADRKGVVQDDGSWVWDGVGRLKANWWDSSSPAVTSILVAPLSTMIHEMLKPGAVLTLRDFERGGSKVTYTATSASCGPTILRRGLCHWTDRIIDKWGKESGKVQDDGTWSMTFAWRGLSIQDPFGDKITSLTASY